MTEDSLQISVPLEQGGFAAVNRRQFMSRDTSNLRKIHSDGRGRANWRAMRVLVVGAPHPTARNARVEQVRRSGHTVILAADGFVALRLAAAQRPDVVVSGTTRNETTEVSYRCVAQGFE